ncbi:DUF58 domain-containing protein [Deinococcus peraridilitoris]|nr:DUF58 domain-containing protein [Deinococcus peraridilitoris]
MLSFLPWLGLLAVLVLLTWLLYRTPPQVDVRRDLPAAVFAGGSVTLTLQIRVRSRLPVRILLEDPPPRTVVPSSTIDLGGLLWSESRHELRSTLNANRRGVYTWSGITVRWADPFGVFWHTATLPLVDSLEVYPGTHGLELPTLLRPLLSEGALSRTIGLEDPLSLRGARPYVLGDPPQRVAWKLSARTGELMVRELERTANSTLQVHVDQRGSADYLESAVRLAASLVQEALELALPVSVSSAEGATETGTSPEALRLALRRLAQLERREQNAPIPVPRPGANLIVLTQEAGDALVTAALHARAGASRVVIVVLPEGFYLEPGEKGRSMRSAPPDQVRELERRAGILAQSGVLVYVLRGNHSILKLGA